MRRGMLIVVALLAACAGAAAGAASTHVAIAVTDALGGAVAGAVVTLSVAGRRSDPAEAAMHQRDKAFYPPVVAIGTGSRVRFPNDDPFLHHVYSFSAAKSFEIDLYSRDQEPVVEFDRAGVVVIGCNIHDDMRGYIVVTDAPYRAVTGADGRAEFAGVPAGRHAGRAWHADATAEASFEVTIPADASHGAEAVVALDLRRRPGHRLDELERGDYE